MTTGATPAQIERAKQRHPLWPKLHDDRRFCDELDMRADDWAPLFVDEREIIVDRTGLAIAIECMRWLANTDIMVPGADAAGERLAAALKEPTE